MVSLGFTGGPFPITVLAISAGMSTEGTYGSGTYFVQGSTNDGNTPMVAISASSLGNGSTCQGAQLVATYTPDSTVLNFKWTGTCTTTDNLGTNYSPSVWSPGVDTLTQANLDFYPSNIGLSCNVPWSVGASNEVTPTRVDTKTLVSKMVISGAPYATGSIAYALKYTDEFSVARYLPLNGSGPGLTCGGVLKSRTPDLRATNAAESVVCTQTTRPGLIGQSSGGYNVNPQLYKITYTIVCS